MFSIKKMLNIKEKKFFKDALKIKKELHDLKVSKIINIISFSPISLSLLFFISREIILLGGGWNSLLNYSFPDLAALFLFFLLLLVMSGIIVFGLQSLIHLLINKFLFRNIPINQIKDFDPILLYDFKNINKVKKSIKNLEKNVDKSDIEFILKKTKYEDSYNENSIIYSMLKNHLSIYNNNENIHNEKDDIIKIVKDNFSNKNQCTILKRLEEIIKIENDNIPENIIQNINKENKELVRKKDFLKNNKQAVIKNI